MKKSAVQFLPLFGKLFFCALLVNFLQFNTAWAQCGHALSFDPDEDSFVYLGEGQEMIYDLENNFTMEFWIKPQKTIKPGMIAFHEQYDGWGGQNYVVFPGWYPASEDACGVGISAGTNGVAVIEAGDEYMPVSLVHYTSISPTEWTHIAVVYSGRIPSLYINGSWVATGPSVSPKAHVYPTATVGDVSTFEGYDLGPFAGVIDEFRIWSIAFSSSTIAAWYDKYTNVNHPYYSFLHTFWKFDEISGETATDASGNGHTGVIVNPPLRVAGWAPIGATLPVVSAGSDEETYFGYSADECVTKTAVVTGGEGPYAYSWTLSRSLLAGETLTGAGTATVTVCLVDDAELCMTVTDVNGCITSDCLMIDAEDVRCNTGNSQIQKVMVCHNGNEICVDASAVQAHLSHGDYLGYCTAIRGTQTINGSSSPGATDQLLNVFSVFPNPGKGLFQINTASVTGTLRIINSSGQQVKQISLNGQQRVQLNLEQPGLYYLQLQNGKEVITKKLLVAH